MTLREGVLFSIVIAIAAIGGGVWAWLAGLGASILALVAVALMLAVLIVAPIYLVGRGRSR